VRYPCSQPHRSSRDSWRDAGKVASPGRIHGIAHGYRATPPDVTPAASPRMHPGRLPVSLLLLLHCTKRRRAYRKGWASCRGAAEGFSDLGQRVTREPYGGPRGGGSFV